jgi:hypothetical protein
MDWKGRRESENVEDRRMLTPGRAAAGGVGVLLLALVTYLLGGDPQKFFNQLQMQNNPQPGVCMGIGIVLGFSFLVYSQSRGQDAKHENKGWVDYDDLKETERLKERPGNYQVLAAVSDCFDRAYRVRPDCSRDA